MKNIKEWNEFFRCIDHISSKNLYYLTKCPFCCDYVKITEHLDETEGIREQILADYFELSK